MSVVVAVVVAGCTSIAAGSPTAVTSSSSNDLIDFDPCTAFNDSLITQAGLVPSSKVPYGAGSQPIDEAGCLWKSQDGGEFPTFTANIGKSGRSLDEYRLNPLFETTEAVVASRPTIDFATSPDSPDCNLAIQVEGGVAVVAIVPSGTTYTRQKSCSDAQRISEAIAPQLP